MSYQETAVEIEREIEKFTEARVINRFVILSILFHVNDYQRKPCSRCRFILDFKEYFLFNFERMKYSEIISYFQNYCRCNYHDFYYHSKLLKSIAAIEKEKLKLDIKLKNLIKNGMWTSKNYKSTI